MNANEAFDAGVTALGRDDHPSAIAHLLTARDAAPRDTEIARALEAARTASASQVHVDAPLPVAATDLALMFVLVNAALCAAIALRARGGVLVAALGLWLLSLGAWVTRLATQPAYVVVATADATTYAADDSESLERYRLRRGDELVLIESGDEWLKVAGPQGPAYVPAKNVLQTTHLATLAHR